MMLSSYAFEFVSDLLDVKRYSRPLEEQRYESLNDNLWSIDLTPVSLGFLDFSYDVLDISQLHEIDVRIVAKFVAFSGSKKTNDYRDCYREGLAFFVQFEAEKVPELDRTELDQ